uniref:Gypsy retrotransposon integrase-like protein 1 n=1 Tax=Chrysemys picta bellii TaxID=8478 RepID=A0A8C3P213_CHRPI
MVARRDPPPLSSSNRSRFVVEEGLLYKETLSGGHQEDWPPQRQLVVPVKYRVKLLSLAHDHPSGHAGVNRTKGHLGKSFHWEGMGKDVSAYVRSCEVCQRVGKPQDQVKAPLQPLPIIEVPFQRVAVDILGPFPKKTPRGKQYVLTVMDFATRWPEAVALSNARAKSVSQALADIFARVGWPSEILTDSGANFLAGTMKSLWEAHGVNHLVATPYHHQTNGLVEKFNGTLGAMVHKFVNEHSSDWDLVLQQLLFIYRAVPHPSLGFSPFELIYGHEVKGPLQLVKQQWEGVTSSPGTNILDFVTNLQNTVKDFLALARENLQDAQQERKAWYDKHARERSFRVGDQVMVLKALQATKMEASWQGPFMVRERLGAVNYLLAFPDPTLKPKVYHVNSLKPFCSREFKVIRFTAQQRDDTEWPEEVYYEGKSKGGVEEVSFSIALGRKQRQEIQELCTSFATMFSATPGRTEQACRSIDTGDAHPIRAQPYEMTPQAKTVIEREIQDMLQMGVIRPSKSAWASPVFLVPKPDGEIRFCVDYRKLNAVTCPQNYPIPRTDELLEKLGRAQFISTLDLTKGYWQVPLDDPAKERSAFITHVGLYEFNVLPFGLRNAPAIFQRLVNNLLDGFGEFAVAYLSNVAIFSDSWAEHLGHLQAVFQRIREAGLTVQAKKCQIGLNRVTYLGHQVGQGTINPLRAKVNAIQNWPVPKSKKQVQSFLGLAGYYRRFVPHYSQIATPLTDLTRKNQPNEVQWTEKCQRAFNQLKAALMSDPVLRAPDFDQPFVVSTDASERGIGAVLMQEGPDQQFHPVVFLSKKLSERESHWSVLEKECYAVVYALE